MTLLWDVLSRHHRSDVRNHGVPGNLKIGVIWDGNEVSGVQLWLGVEVESPEAVLRTVAP